MPIFVHIASGDLATKARRGGLRPGKKGRFLNGVFAMPVTPNFQITHQWVREIKQWQPGAVVGVYFRIPDSEQVHVGHYGGPHARMSAAEAAAHVMEQTGMTGVEVIIPRRIDAKEIVRVRSLPQLVGWRHYPGVHGERPRSCPCCQKGVYGSRKIRENYPDD
jgi:hypothetical protein